MGGWRDARAFSTLVDRHSAVDDQIVVNRAMRPCRRAALAHREGLPLGAYASGPQSAEQVIPGEELGHPQRRHVAAGRNRSHRLGLGRFHEPMRGHRRCRIRSRRKTVRSWVLTEFKGHQTTGSLRTSMFPCAQWTAKPSESVVVSDVSTDAMSMM